MNIQELQAENAALKADLKEVKIVLIDITDKLGVTKNGNPVEDLEVSDIISNIMPDIIKASTSGGLIGKAKKMLGGKDETNDLFTKFGCVLKLVPLFEKYKNI